MDFCEWQELLNAVAPNTNSTDVVEDIKNKLQQHNKGIYEEWKENDFNINHIFDSGTLLHFAVRSNYINVVKALLNADADVNVQGQCEETPLHWAAEHGRAWVVGALLKAGAVINVQNYGKQTALHLAAEKSHLEVVQVLIRAGADCNIRDFLKRTPLHWLAKNDCVWVVEALLKAGADANTQDFFGYSPLHWAAQQGNARIVEALLKAGAKMDVQNEKKQTALHVAAKENHSEVVQALLKAGADVNIPDNSVGTPAYYVDVMKIFMLHEIQLKGLNDATPRWLLQHDSDYKREVLQYCNKCSDEVKRMKEKEIGQGITFYDVLINKNINKFASNIRNKSIALMLERYNFANEFPIYANELRRQLKTGKQRMYYLDIATIILTNMLRGSALANFSHIMWMIAENFSNEDIEILRRVVIESLDEKEVSNLPRTGNDLANLEMCNMPYSNKRQRRK